MPEKNSCSYNEFNRRTGRDRRKYGDHHYKGPERRAGGKRRLSDEIEIFFVRLGHFLCRHSIKVLMVVFILVGLLAVQIPRITIDTSSEALLHADDPTLLEYNRFQDQFGRSELIIIAIKPDNVFSPGFIEWLTSFHDAIAAEVPHVRKVNSLVNVRHTYGEAEEVIVGQLLEGWREKEIDWAEIKKRVLGNAYYIDNVVSRDGSLTAVVIETTAAVSPMAEEDDILEAFGDETPHMPDRSSNRHYFSEKESREVVRALNRVVERLGKPDIEIAVSGGPIILNAFNKSTMRDMVRCLAISFSAVIFFLFLLFRRISGVVYPLIVIVSSVVSTLGLMALFGVAIKITTTVLPAFLVAVGVGDSVHLLAICYRKYQMGCSKKEAIIYSLGHSGMAIVMTTLTTAAGLLSFGFAELAAISDLGIFAATGVILALFFTVFMLPPLMVVFPIRQQDTFQKRSLRMDRVLSAFASFSTAHPLKILGCCLLIFGTSILFVSQLEFSDHVVEYFPEGMIVKKDLRQIDQKLKGVITMELIVDTEKAGGVYAPHLLNAIETFSAEAKSLGDGQIFVGKVFSINDILKEIGQALNENNPQYYAVPQDRKMVAQSLLLFENSGADDLERLVDTEFSKTRITIKTPWVDSVIFDRFVAEIKAVAQPIFGDTARISVTGGMVLMARTIPAALRSMTRSYALAFLIITLMMMVLVENVKLGLISMIPNLLPIITIMGVMGFLRVPLDMTTLMIGSIALGLVVDDTVHFMYNFRRYFDKSGSARLAIQETLLGTGRALLITTLVLSFGFFADMFATLSHIQRFGLFTGVTIMLALMADFLLAPALMIVLTRQKKGILKIRRFQ